MFKLNVIWNLIFLCLCRSEVIHYPYCDTQDFAYNVAKVENVVVSLNKTLGYLSQRSSLAINVEIELLLARGNLQFLLDQMTTAVPQKLRGSISDISQMLQTYDFPFQYPNADAEYCMKILVKYEFLYKKTLEALNLGRIVDNSALLMDYESYKSILGLQEQMYTATDTCIKDLLEVANRYMTTGNKCTMDYMCYDYITKKQRYGIMAVHSVFYLTIARMFECGSPTTIEADLTDLCQGVYKEMRLIEQLRFPAELVDVFALQLSFCGASGFGEFAKPRWMNKIISWQTASDGSYVVPGYQTTENTLLSAQAIGALSVYLRALLETDPSFTYDLVVTS